MAGSIGEAYIDIRADGDGFAADVKATAASSMQAVGKSIEGVGKKLTKSVTLPIVGAGLGILAMAGNFQSSMNNVKAITGATGQDFTNLQDTAKELGRTTVFSASEAAEGMKFLGMAGFDTDQIIAAMPGTLALAAATATDLGTTADITSNILTGFGLEAEDAGRLADVLAKGASSSNTDLQGLGDAMKFVAPVASSMGMSIEETTAIVGKLSDAGIQGGMAGTTLRQALSKLANPTGAAGKALDELGVSVKDSSGKMRPFPDIIDDLGASGADAGDLLEIFGDRAGPGMAALLSQGGDSIRDLTKDLEDSGGTAQDMADTQLEGLNGQLALLKSAAEGLAIAIADSGLLDWVTGIVQGFTDWVQSMAETNPKVLKIITIVAGLAAAVGPLLIVIGKSIQSFALLRIALNGQSIATAIASSTMWKFTASLLANPVVLIVIAIAALVAALVLFFTKTETGKAIVTAVWDAIKAAIAFVVDWFTDTAIPAFVAAWDWIKDAASAVADWYSANLAPIFEAAGDAIAAAFQWISDTATIVWDAIKEAAQGVADWYNEFLAPVFEAFGELFGAIFGRVSESATGFWENLQIIFDGIAAAVTWLWEEGIQPTFDGIAEGFQWLLDAIQPTLDFLALAWSILWGRVQAAWDTIGPPLIAIVTTAFEVLWAYLQTVWDAIKTVVEIALTIITGIIKTVTAIIKGDWGAAWDAIKEMLSKVWDLMKGFVQRGIDRIKSVISSVLNALKSVWGTIWNWIKSKVSGIWNGIKTLVSNAINGVKSTVSRVLNSIKTAWSTAWNAVKTKVSEIWDGIVTGVQTGIDTVLGFVGGLKDSVLGFFAGAGSWLWSAGRDILNGLWDGLKSIWSSITGWVSGLGGKIMDLKGPEEYDKNLLVPAGKWIMGGLHEGLEKEFGGVEKLLSGMGKKMAMEISPTGGDIGSGRSLRVPEAASMTPQVNVSTPTPGAMNLSKSDLDYLIGGLAAELWPMARAADVVGDFARRGQSRQRMGNVRGN